MDEALRIYLTDELKLVDNRIIGLTEEIKQKLAVMNLEMGKLEGIVISQQVRKDEILIALGLKEREEEIEEDATETA